MYVRVCKWCLWVCVGDVYGVCGCRDNLVVCGCGVGGCVSGVYGVCGSRGSLVVCVCGCEGCKGEVRAVNYRDEAEATLTDE